ncbi:MAG: hypothetical protein QOH06_2276 [Acidobacteriota bacterium]|jgi:photosystem II stability/assembly factor-like uncharacterized protein|nr:hypothetical protein [Acidobacteriota bacterium]
MRPFAAVLILLASALPAAAGIGVWTPLGPDGGPVRSLAVDPSDPETAYADTIGGLYKTVDGGQSWNWIHPKWTDVLGFAGDTLYAEFFPNPPVKSTDGGLTWTPAPNLPRTLHAMVADPKTPTRIWAAARKVYRSDDSGANWQELNMPKGQSLALRELAVDPAGRSVYIIVADSVLRSDDLGKSWQRGGRVAGKAPLRHLAAGAGKPSVLYASTEGALFRSLNRGNKWQRIRAVAFRGTIQDIQTEGNRVYVSVSGSGSGSGIFYSSNQGATWTRGAGSPADPGRLATAPGLLYAATDALLGPGGPYRSVDRGATWERVSHGLHAETINTVAVHPTNPDILYIGADRAGLLRSTDRGATWEAMDLGTQGRLEFFGFNEILIDPPTIYALGMQDWNFRSDDDGETWQRLQGAPDMFTIVRDPRQPGALWGSGLGLFHSDDRGEHWTTAGDELSSLYLYEVLVDPRDPKIVLVAGHTKASGGGDPETVLPRLLRSADGGTTWQRHDSGIEANAVLDMALDPAAPDTLYAGTDTGLFRSTDAGQTWTRSAIDEWAEQLIAAPTSPTTLYADVDTVGLVRSTDGGQTWIPAGEGVEGELLYGLTVDPNDPDRLYVGVLFLGLFTYETP